MRIPDLLCNVLTKEMLIEERVKNKTGIVSGLYYGKIEGDGANVIADKSPAIKLASGKLLESTVTAKSGIWKNSAGYNELWNQIEDQRKKVIAQVERKVNIEQFPDDYYTLIDMIRLDFTRRRMEEIDFTDRLGEEIVRADFGRSVKIDEFLPFTGAFIQRKGAGEGVPLIEQKTGETGHVDMYLYALGHERSLEDELYNLDIYSLQKVNAAVTRAHRALRNDLAVGQYIGYSLPTDTWAANQQIAADTNASYDLALYRTLDRAIDRVVSLIDPQTGQEINAPRLALIVDGNAIARRCRRVINGQLAVSQQSAGIANIVQNVGPLEIDEIWVYKGDVLYTQGKKIEYPGVPAGYAYLVVIGDNAFYTLTKRGLTMEMGRGDVLTLSREKRAWYFVQGGYTKEHFGETGGCQVGSGFCVEIVLPEYEPET